jgi:hypothetical protein
VASSPLGRESESGFKVNRRSGTVHKDGAVPEQGDPGEFVKKVAQNLLFAVVAWHCAHRACLPNRRSQVRIPNGV